MFNCLICRNSKYNSYLENLTSVYDRNNEYNIYKCTNCNLAQTYPRPNLEEVTSLYSNVYQYDIHSIFSMEKTIRAKKLTHQVFKNVYPKNVFEIGCGQGEFLSYLHSLGVYVEGVEPDLVSGLKANKHIGRNAVIHSIFETMDKSRLKLFSYIVISHVLEHFVDPIQYLRQIYLNTDENVRLLIVVPNFQKIPKGKFARYWGYLQVPIHISHFTISSLDKLLLNSGFKIETIRYRNADFMSIGLFILNIFNIKSQNVKINGLKKNLLKTLAIFWTLFYRFGRQDLIVTVSKM